jgi:hypothetical protein
VVLVVGEVDVAVVVEVLVVVTAGDAGGVAGVVDLATAVGEAVEDLGIVDEDVGGMLGQGVSRHLKARKRRFDDASIFTTIFLLVLWLIPGALICLSHMEKS